MNKVFVDSGGWIACINKKDKNHKKAKRYFKRIRKNKIPMVTSNYVKAETITWLRYNISHQISLKVIKLWEEAEKKSYLDTYWVSKEISSEAGNIFENYDDQGLSFTDCTSFAICRKLDIRKVFGFDSDFNTLGYLLAPFQVKESQNNYNILRPYKENLKKEL